MAKVKITSGNLFNIGDAIRDTNGTQTRYKPSEMAGAVANLGDSILNGKLEECFAWRNDGIGSNRFVEAVNNSTDIERISSKKVGEYIATYNSSFALKLSSTTALILFKRLESLYGCVCTFNSNTDYSFGPQILIDDSIYSTSLLSADLLSSGKVLVTNGGTDYNIWGMIISISGNNITVNSRTQMTTGSSKGYVHTEKITSSKVFVSYTQNNATYGVVWSINGNTITSGESVKITTSDTYVCSYYNSPTRLSDSKVFISYSDVESYNLYAVICNINGNSITLGERTLISNVYDAAYSHHSIALTSDSVFVTNKNGSYLYGVICTIDGNTITVGTNTSLSTNSYSANIYNITKLSDSSVFVTHYYRSSGYLYGVVCTIRGDTITKGTTTALISYNYAAYGCQPVALSSTQTIVKGKYGENMAFIPASVSGTTISTGYISYADFTDKLLYEHKKCLQLTDEKYLILYTHSYYDDDGGHDDIYGCFCYLDNSSINNTMDIDLKNQFLILDSKNASRAVTASVALAENKIFLTYMGESNNELYAKIGTINGETISFGSAFDLGTTTDGGRLTSCKLSSNKVCIVYVDNSHYPCAIICSISGNNITAGSAVTLYNISSNDTNKSVTKLSDDKIFVALGIQKELYGGVCTINGTTITPYVNKIAEGYSGMVVGCAALSSSKVFVISRNDSSDMVACLYGRLATINGTSSTYGSSVALTPYPYYDYPEVIALSDSKIFTVYNNGNTYGRLYGMSCTISGNTINLGSNTSINTNNNTDRHFPDLLLADNNTKKIMIVHSFDDALGVSTVFNPDTTYKESVSTINGITQNYISYGYSGNIWLLDN